MKARPALQYTLYESVIKICVDMCAFASCDHSYSGKLIFAAARHTHYAHLPECEQRSHVLRCASRFLHFELLFKLDL